MEESHAARDKNFIKERSLKNKTKKEKTNKTKNNIFTNHDEILVSPLWS